MAVKVKNGFHPRHSMDEWMDATESMGRRWVEAILVGVMVFAITFAGAGWWVISNKVTSKSMDIPVMTESGGRTIDYDPIDPSAGEPIDVLVLGQDTREGKANADIGGNDPNDRENHQADTAMIVHVSADRKRIDVVSLPRDSIVNQPACAITGGTAPARKNVMLNSTFAYGWDHGGNLESAVSCELATVNEATGLNITHSIVVDFAGMSRMIDSIDGVDICVPAGVNDVNTGLDLKQGMTHMDGMMATQYARVRHGVDGADGSDIMRTARQQAVVRALLKQVLKNGVMSNPHKLYSLGVSALDSLRMSSGLASAPSLAGLAYSLRGLDMDNVQSMTVPTTAWPKDPNRVVWSPEADSIWKALMEDRPLGSNDASNEPSDDGTGTGTNESSSEPPSQDSVPQVQEETPIPDSASTDQAPQDGFVMNEETGLLENRATGALKDPVTGGSVDPRTGYIRDKNTGSIIGLADRYVNLTICKVMP